MQASRGAVRVLATGGTIASRLSGDTGVVARLSGSELLATIPGVESLEPLVVYDLMRAGGYLITAQQMFEVAQAVRAAADEDIDGIVVTHGTDTMEETAYLTDLLYAGPKPVVFTGAQRHCDAGDADGPDNLRDAITVARSVQARDTGASIAMGGRIDSAREATKMHTFAPRAFGTLEHGQLGQIQDGEVTFFHRRNRPPVLEGLEYIEHRVSAIKLYAGIDGAFIETAIEQGARGIVVECFGIGNANHAVLEAVAEATRRGVVVLVVSRCPAGMVAPVYGNAGGFDLANAGAIFGGNLSGQKARVLLMAALAATPEPEAVAALLDPHLKR